MALHCDWKKVCAFVLLLALGVVHAAPSNQQYMFLISVDGMRHEYLHNYTQYGANLPNLEWLISQGTLAFGARSVYPAQTFPAHTSIATGVNPARHGIECNQLTNQQAQNYFYRRIEKPTIFEAAKKEAGMEVFGVDWPVTVGAPFKCIYPGNDDDPADKDEAEFLWSTMKGPYESVFSDPHDLFDVTDQQRAALAVAFLAGCNTTFGAIHFNELDAVEHWAGVFSQEAWKQLEVIDAGIGSILDQIEKMGILNQSTIIVTSDHGFVNDTGGQVNPEALLNSLGLEGNIYHSDYISFLVNCGGMGGLYVNDDESHSTMDQIQLGLNFLDENKHLFGIHKIYNSTEVEATGGFKGAYAIIEARLGITIGGDDSVYSTGHGGGGSHGYSPEHEDMYACFLAFGPNIKKGYNIDVVNLVDIAPTIAYILGIEFNNTDGKVLNEIFEN